MVMYKKLRLFVRAMSVLLLALSLMAVPSVAAHEQDGGHTHLVGDGVADTPLEMDQAQKQAEQHGG